MSESKIQLFEKTIRGNSAEIKKAISAVLEDSDSSHQFMNTVQVGAFYSKLAKLSRIPMHKLKLLNQGIQKLDESMHRVLQGTIVHESEYLSFALALAETYVRIPDAFKQKQKAQKVIAELNNQKTKLTVTDRENKILTVITALLQRDDKSWTTLPPVLKSMIDLDCPAVSELCKLSKRLTKETV